MSAVFDGILGQMFILDLFVISFIALVRLPKRQHFCGRTALSGVMAVAFSVFADWAIAPTKEMFWAVFLLHMVKFSVVVLALLFCYRTSVWKALFGAAIAYFVQHTSFCVETLVLNHRASLAATTAFQTAVIALMVAALYFALFRKLSEEALDRLNLVQTVSLVLIIMLVCVCCNTLAGVRGEDSVSFYLMDLCCNLVGLLYQFSIFHNVVLEKENVEIQRLLEKSGEQYRISKENIDMINIKCHDLKHQIHQFRSEGKIDAGALAEMERTISRYDATVHTGNAALDVVLTEKSLLCASKDIRFTCIADGEGLDFMDACDVYALFGNALDNAIEATEELAAQKRLIGLTVRRLPGMCVINVQNYTDRALQFMEGVPITNKEDKNEHGFGVKSMKLLIEKYGGELSFTLQDEIFNLDMVLPGTAS